MPATPNWTPEQAAKAREVSQSEKLARMKALADARVAESAEQERIRAFMREKLGDDVQFIACRRGKAPVFNQRKE